MIMSDQTKNRIENRSFGSSYNNLATRFEKILQSLISDIRIGIKLYHLLKNWMVRKWSLKII